MTQQPQGSPQNKVNVLAGIVRNLRLAWRLLADGRVSLASKLILPGLAAAYLLWPADLAPDIIPVLGQLDDLALIALGITLFIELCPKEIVSEHRDNLSGKPPAPPAGSGGGEIVDGEYRVID